jgi:hypothetical protein
MIWRIASKPIHLKGTVTSTNRRKLVSDVRVLEKRATPGISHEYNEFKKLFKKELGKEALPKH